MTSLRQSSCQIPRLEICERGSIGKEEKRGVGEGNKKKQLKARSVVEYIMVSFRFWGRRGAWGGLKEPIVSNNG